MNHDQMILRSTSNASTSHASKKRKISMDDMAEQVAEIKAELKGIHGFKYNELQYRLWSEVVVSGMHTDMHEPPSYPMFGGPRKTPVKQRSDSQASPLPVPPFLQHHALWSYEANASLILKSW